ncbi:MAG: hypothetical protein JSR77_10520 [Planctomycetes bacterium]|nr:hypothetical protein [Planctomycetota bacterium]
MSTPLPRRDFLALAGLAAVAGPALAGQRPAARNADAKSVMAKAIAYLRSQQDKATGGWSVAPQGPVFPAITALVVSGMLSDAAIKDTDPAVAAGVGFILSKQQPDGGIYDKLLPSYNTSICLTALSKVNNPAKVADARQKALAFLRTLQWGEEAKPVIAAGEPVAVVTKDNPFYGGVGYGKSGRPDLSNTAFFVEALAASGVERSDPAFQRALAFLQRVQMVESVKGPDGKDIPVNDQPYAKGSRQGGFIYSTSESKDKVGSGQSFAGNLEESLSDGTTASRLRCYGSMTYSGFKSYLYAGLKKDDPRVLAARGWIEKNYTVDENPGVGTDGQYYFYLVFARALQAFGEPVVKTASGDRRWADDLVAKLASLQQEDGSFKVVDDRWMENNPVLITAYALCALGETVKSA